MGVRQIRQVQNPFEGLAESIVTSNRMFWGDAAMITGSLTTSSATASRWTIEGFEGTEDYGFRIALPSGAANTGGWQTNKVLTVQGIFSMDTISSWVRILRTPSASSTTMVVAVYVGP